MERERGWESDAVLRSAPGRRDLGVFDAVSSRRSASGARRFGASSDVACDGGIRRGRRCRERRVARRIPSGSEGEARLAPESRSASRRPTSAETRGRRFFFDTRDSRVGLNLLRAAAADVSRTSAAFALAWVERTLRETVAGMVSETRDDDGRRTRRACAHARLTRYVARSRREGRNMRREVRRCRGARVAGRGALCRRARGSPSSSCAGNEMCHVERFLRCASRSSSDGSRTLVGAHLRIGTNPIRGEIFFTFSSSECAF